MSRTQSIKAPARHNTHATCTIGLSYDEDIKLRRRRRWKKGHVYIHSAKSVSEPLTRLPVHAIQEYPYSVTRTVTVYSNKYKFYKTEVLYLRLIISINGIQIDLKKVKVIVN